MVLDRLSLVRSRDQASISSSLPHQNWAEPPSSVGARGRFWSTPLTTGEKDSVLAQLRQSPLQVMDWHSCVILAVVPSGSVVRIFT